MGSQLAGAARVSESGPRLTDEQLFQGLDPLAKGLASARVAASRGAYTEARKALAEHLRTRADVNWLSDTRLADGCIDSTMQFADDIVAGRVNIVGLPHQFPDGRIDWFYNPTLDCDAHAPNHEWQWQLGRMDFWNLLSRAYEATGDEKYAAAFVSQLRSWIVKCPRPDSLSNSTGSAWRTIECGIRMSGAWPNAFDCFLKSPSFTDDDIVLFVKSCVEHARYLRKYPSAGNWLTMEMNGLYTVGGLFPEFAEAREWRSFAVERLYGELGSQFLPDGAQIELSTTYHQVALSNMVAIYDKAAVFGRLAELPSDYVRRTERAYEYDMMLMTPDRGLPRLNDAWHCNVPKILRKAASLFEKRDDFKWIATDGREGREPEKRSHALKWAGYFAMRSGWDKDANYLCFDAGPLGYAHVHQDKLSVALWAYGRELLFDGGGGPYEDSEWRDYDIDTFSHNTVIVDGLPQRRQTSDRRANVSKSPVDATWQNTEAYDYAAASYSDGYGSEGARIATHHRRILFLKPDIFVVADTLIPNDELEHTYEARWHLLSTTKVFDEMTLCVVTTDAGRPNLSIVPLLGKDLEVRTACAQTEDELLGWFVRKAKRPTPATTVLHARRGAGTQHFITLLVPLRSWASPRVIDVRSTGALSADVSFADGRALTVSCDEDAAKRIRAVETRADGSRGRSVG